MNVWPSRTPAALLLFGATLVNAKTASVIVTAQMRANAIANCQRYQWAAQYRDRLIARVKPWLSLSNEELWRLLPSQEMPRDSSVNRGQGCPKCGMDHYCHVTLVMSYN